MATATKSRRKRKAPVVRVTVATFNTAKPYEVIREGTIADFRPLTYDDYLPAAGTPLRDATARMIAHGDGLRGKDHVSILVLVDESASMTPNREAVVKGVNRFVAGMSEVEAVDPKTAGTVLAVVFTDGEENSSREVDHATLQTMIREREESGFTFIFLGAAIDAWDQGLSLGFSGAATGQTVSYRNTPRGTAAAMGKVTTDSAAYLSNNAGYFASKAGTSMSSVLEDGTEVSSNINASGTNVTAPNPFQNTFVSPYSDVADALKNARAATTFVDLAEAIADQGAATVDPEGIAKLRGKGKAS